jgi:hypothetical protein
LLAEPRAPPSGPLLEEDKREEIKDEQEYGHASPARKRLCRN